MDKKQLLEAYQLVERMKQAGFAVTNEHLKVLDRKEEEYINEVVRPQMEELMSTLLSGLRKTYDVVGYFISPTDKLIVFEESKSQPVKNDAPKDSAESEEMEVHDDGDILISDKIIKTFTFKVMKYLEKTVGLSAFLPYIVQKTDYPNRHIEAGGNIELKNVLLEGTLADAKQRNHQEERWFETQFDFRGRTMYWSTQWCNDGKSHALQLETFFKLINKLYPNKFVFGKEGKNYIMRVK